MKVFKMSYYDYPVETVVRSYREFFMFSWSILSHYIEDNVLPKNYDSLREFTSKVLKLNLDEVELLLNARHDLCNDQLAKSNEKLLKLRRKAKKISPLDVNKETDKTKMLTLARRITKFQILSKDCFSLTRNMVEVVGPVATCYDRIAETFESRLPLSLVSIGFFEGVSNSYSEKEKEILLWDKNKNHSPVARLSANKPTKPKINANNGSSGLLIEIAPPVKKEVINSNQNEMRISIILKRIIEKLVPSVRIDPSNIDLGLVKFILKSNKDIDLEEHNLLDLDFVKKLAKKLRVRTKL